MPIRGLDYGEAILRLLSVVLLGFAGADGL